MLTDPSTSDKRILILRAALELLASCGFHGFSMKQLAERAGVAAGTLYLYFRDREELIRQLHLEIIQERLEREFNLDLLATAPSVEYEIETTGGELKKIDNPSDMPDFGQINEIREPWMDLSIIAPSRYIGTIMDLCTNKRGIPGDMTYLDEERVQLKYEIPLAELIIEFYDQLKSRTQGYASLDYSFASMRAANLVKLDVLVNGTLIAHGEVVVVNEKFGIRMTDVISPSERIKKLR